MSNTTTETRPTPALLQSSGKAIRLAARSAALTTPTSGVAASYLQANLIILPFQYASDFRQLCARNPVPCPLIAESTRTGCWDEIKSHIPNIDGRSILTGCDIRHDVPKYMVYKDSKLVKSHCVDVEAEWTSDHVAFLIGCSFSFETALAAAGLTPRHTQLQRNVSVYRTTLPLNPAGVFTDATYIVSMRSYKASDITRVRDITRPFLLTHGEPIAWGWDAVARLGIRDIDMPEWGDAPLGASGQPLGQSWGSEDEVPLFWGCGVTPQEAAISAGLKGVVMSHAPGHMLLLDCKDEDIIR